MAIEVRIPTILRTYTGGAKAVEATGDTLAELITTWTPSTPGLKGRLINGRRAAPLRQRLRQRRGRPLPRWPRDAAVADGDTVTILPAVAGGAAESLASRWPCATTRLLDACRRHAAGRPAPALARRADVRLWAKLEDRNPTGTIKDRPALCDGRGGRGGRPAHARLHDPRADQRQHRHLAGHGRPSCGLPAGLRDAGEHLDRAQPAAADVRRGDHLLAGGGRLEPGRRDGEADRRRAPGLGDALPVRQPGQRPRALRDAPGRSCCATCRRSPTSWPAWAPPAR